MTLDPKIRRQLSGALPYLFFAAVVLVVFFPAFFLGAVLGGHHDRADQMLPFYAAYSRAFKAGEIPQWNPYVFCGKSMSGSGMFVFFYPLYWIVFALPESAILRSTTFVLVFHVGLALVGSYHLFRRLGADRFWATLSSLMYVFSSSATLQMATELNFTSFAYPPILLWLVAGQRQRPDEGSAWSGLLPNALAQTAVYALLLLCSNVQLVLYTLAVCFAYSFYRALARVEGAARLRFDWRRLCSCAAAFAGGFAIAAARWIPFYFANKVEAGSPVTYETFLQTTATEWSDLVRFVMPEFFGTDGYADFYGHINHFESLGGYVSVAGCALTLYGLLHWNRRTAFWNGWLIFTLLLVLHTPVTWLHYVATGRTMLHFTRFAWLAPLPCAALVAIEGRAFFANVRKRTWGFLAAFGAVAVAAAGYAYAVRLTDAQRAIIGEQSRESIGLFVVLLVLLALLLLVARRFGESSRIFRGALLATTMIDLFSVFAYEANISRPLFESPSDFAFPAEDELAARSVSEPTRMYRVFREPVVKNVKIYSQFTLNDRWITLGAYSSSGYDNGAPTRLLELYEAPQGGGRESRIAERVIPPPTMRAAELTSTAVFLSNEHSVVRVPQPLPRTRLFSRYQVLEDRAALRTLYDPSFDLESSLLLHVPPTFPSVDGEARGEVAIVEDDLNRVTLHVRAEQPSLVLLNDTFNRGWRVEVDGRPAVLLRANYAFRAVEVAAGEHTVQWIYHQRGLGPSVATSLASLAALALVSGWVGVRRRRQMKEE